MLFVIYGINELINCAKSMLIIDKLANFLFRILLYIEGFSSYNQERRKNYRDDKHYKIILCTHWMLLLLCENFWRPPNLIYVVYHYSRAKRASADVVIVLIDGQRLAVEDARNYHHVVITDYLW